ncbi:MAG: hypothetical protein ACREIY_07770 [Candidatus Rokuibacteriota bacterium]
MSGPAGPERREDEISEYAQGELQVRRGSVNRWLLVLYAVLTVWGVYYLFKYWGGP